MRESDEEWLQSMKNLVAAAEGNIALRLLDILSPTQRRARRDVVNAMGWYAYGRSALNSSGVSINFSINMVKDVIYTNSKYDYLSSTYLRHGVPS